MFNGEHPFAQYVRILGKGKTGSRNLTREESYQAMLMILKGEVEPVQLGALMMLMRHQEESGEELAGFVDAAKEYIQIPDQMPTIDFDWSSYAGKARRPPWFVLTALLLAENNHTVLMHGSCAHTPGRVYSEQAFEYLGVPIASSLVEAAQHIKESNFAYLPLKNFLPRLEEIMNLKPLLGLRSPVNTFTRLLNPCQSACSIQGIHHPGYKDCHQEASSLLKQPKMCVIKGDSGETEWNPDTNNLVRYVLNGEEVEEQWQALFAKRHVNDKDMSLEKLKNVWSGKVEDEYAYGAVVGTSAISLYTLGKAETHADALELARKYWLNRDKARFSQSRI
ncbi:MAG: glycosyl transferase family protein [Gammaproteobacteria bacterium]|nr:glycosyl transferase family protein [Gammaproteobacteria bacterium]